MKKYFYKMVAVFMTFVILPLFSCKTAAHADPAGAAERTEEGRTTAHPKMPLDAMELRYGNTQKIEYPQEFPEDTVFAYTSSDETVAKVKDGIVIANDTGLAVVSITASSGSGVWEFEQEVKVRLSSFKLKAYDANLYQINAPRFLLETDGMVVAKGKTARLRATVGLGCMSKVTFRSSDKSVVKVSGDGAFCEVTGIKEGDAAIAATFKVGHRTQVLRIPVTVTGPDIPVENPKDAMGYEEGDAWEGDYVYFGRFEQDNNLYNGSEMILWRVLEVTEDSILLLSDTSLAARPYHEVFEEAVWEDCNLRAWLNSEFINRAFTGAEAAALVQNTIITKANPVYGDGSSVETKDYVYLLSSEEAQNPAYGFYPALSATETRSSGISAYALANDGYANEAGRVCWWLRDNGVTGQFGAYVFTAGGIAYDYFVGRRNDGVRPVIRLNLGKISFAVSEEGHPVVVAD